MQFPVLKKKWYLFYDISAQLSMYQNKCCNEFYISLINQSKRRYKLSSSQHLQFLLLTSKLEMYNNISSR